MTGHLVIGGVLLAIAGLMLAAGLFVALDQQPALGSVRSFQVVVSPEVLHP
ncbi:hypothetical protein [Actinopolymorpha alba]|uniref:hypothetical protein n=1 Tax=Actinopolymorpha alba TaxID=533267 RepID=UPI000362E0C4|nr:hypothetical protein [Actinopolymorpha alba]